MREQGKAFPQELKLNLSLTCEAGARALTPVTDSAYVEFAELLLDGRPWLPLASVGQSVFEVEAGNLSR